MKIRATARRNNTFSLTIPLDKYALPCKVVFMNTSRNVALALERISEIHGHLAKGEIYRGYRPLPAALTGVVGIVGAALQNRIVAPGDFIEFVIFWAGLAALGLAIHGVSALRRLAREGSPGRRRTLRVEGQFVPAIAAGAMLTGGVLAAGASSLGFLPGAWALLFSLGLFSCRPYLPRRIGWVALFYLLAGGGLLLLSVTGTNRLGWALGATFGVGQLAAAVVLHRDEARSD